MLREILRTAYQRIKVKAKAEDNLEFLGLMVFIGFIAFVVSRLSGL